MGQTVVEKIAQLVFRRVTRLFRMGRIDLFDRSDVTRRFAVRGSACRGRQTRHAKDQGG